MATDAPRLTLYGRRGCHLCEDMASALRVLQRDQAFDFEIVDVDADPRLARRYGERVPVLAHEARVLSEARLDIPAVTAFLTQFR